MWLKALCGRNIRGDTDWFQLGINAELGQRLSVEVSYDKCDNMADSKDIQEVIRDDTVKIAVTNLKLGELL